MFMPIMDTFFQIEHAFCMDDLLSYLHQLKPMFSEPCSRYLAFLRKSEQVAKFREIYQKDARSLLLSINIVY